MQEDDDGEVKVSGYRMKSEGETPYEPHVLGRMVPERDKHGGHIIKVFFEKDRSGILAGKTFEWPDYETITPVVAHLSGKTQGKVGTMDEAAEKDVAAKERQAEAVAQERQALFEQIRSAIRNAKTVEELNAAWSLTKGKKTKLLNKYDELVAEGAQRKQELSTIEEAA